MIFHDLVIIGGGMAAMAMVKTFRAEDPVSSVLMISDQADLPARKPPLSKQLWKGMKLSEVFYNPAKFNVEYKPRTHVQQVDFDRHVLTLDSGERVRYDRLVIATGLQPRRLAGDDSDVVHFNTLADYRRLKRHVEAGKSVVIIGGGLLGVELASSLIENGSEVRLVMPHKVPLTSYLSNSLAERVGEKLAAAGVEQICNRRAVRIEHGGIVHMDDGSTVQADLVISVIGQRPSLDFLPVDKSTREQGLPVDERLRVRGIEDVFACGDVIRFGESASEFRHEENALRSGAALGRSLAGRDIEFLPSSFLYSEFLDLRLESIGIGDASRLKAIGEDWDSERSRGICILTEGDVVRRVSLLNYRMDSDTADMFATRLIGRSSEADHLQMVRTVLDPAA